MTTLARGFLTALILALPVAHAQPNFGDLQFSGETIDLDLSTEPQEPGTPWETPGHYDWEIYDPPAPKRDSCGILCTINEGLGSLNDFTKTFSSRLMALGDSVMQDWLEDAIGAIAGELGITEEGVKEWNDFLKGQIGDGAFPAEGAIREALGNARLSNIFNRQDGALAEAVRINPEMMVSALETSEMLAAVDAITASNVGITRANIDITGALADNTFLSDLADQVDGAAAQSLTASNNSVSTRAALNNTNELIHALIEATTGGQRHLEEALKMQATQTTLNTMALNNHSRMVAEQIKRERAAEIEKYQLRVTAAKEEAAQLADAFTAVTKPLEGLLMTPTSSVEGLQNAFEAANVRTRD